MPAYTPEPWEVDSQHPLDVVQGGEIVVAGCRNENDARLIAAAPETAAERDRLKEINRELLEALEQAVQAQDDGIPVWPTLHAAEQARAVIAKAKGE